MADSIVIIGAGVGGLSAGCYAQMNGYQSQIFEMHDRAGGLCTNWKRKDYTIDGCLHWLVGTSPGSTYSFLWDELGILKGKAIVNFDRVSTMETHDGRTLSLFASPKQFEEHLSGFAPEDHKMIAELAGTVRRLVGFRIPSEKAPEVSSICDTVGKWYAMARHLNDFQKYRRLTITDLAMRFKSPILREAFQLVLPESSALTYLFTLAWMYEKSAGYVSGGSGELSSALERRYLDLGGKVKYGAKVQKVVVEGGKAVGVRLEDGSEVRANAVVSAADGHATIFDLLGGAYIDEKIRSYYEILPIFQPIVYVALGVNLPLSGIPKVALANFIRFEKPLTVGGVEHTYLMFNTHNYDAALAPPGKSIITCMIESRFAYWEDLMQDLAAYRAAKARIAEIVISELDRRFPGLASKVEVSDVATPATFNRYTGNWQGSYEGFLLTPQTLNLRIPQTLPGLGDFYMAGQWVQPGGGIPGAAVTARWAIQMLCKKDRRRFVVPHLSS